jgi:hypothetical protein
VEVEEEIKKWNIPNLTSIADLQKQRVFDIEGIKGAIRERKAYDFIIENAKVS